MKNWLEALLDGAETPRDGGSRHETEETVRRDPPPPEAEWGRWPALRPAPVLPPEDPAAPAEPAGYRRPAEAAPAAPPLTVEAVDRAARRDSRRYDGGMSIY